VTGKTSQCSNCGETFNIQTKEVLYCTTLCREEHNLFQYTNARDKKMPGTRARQNMIRTPLL
jgi:predicted  nucleic acid-binding Zn-ribbon protein